MISSSIFINNTSEYGTIFNVPFINDKSAYGIMVNNCQFTNNTASKYGGVIYSLGEFNNKHVNFYNCNFYDNHAKLGNVLYSYSSMSSPIMNNCNLNSNDIVTLPTYFEVDEYSYEGDEISILSGENIPEGITCK